VLVTVYTGALKDATCFAGWAHAIALDLEIGESDGKLYRSRQGTRVGWVWPQQQEQQTCLRRAGQTNLSFST
jgi:hypothetical protein